MISILQTWLETVMDTTPVRKLIHMLNRLWVRIALIGVLSLVAIAVAQLVSPQLPAGSSQAIGAGSVETLLQIIANSMLAVTTFSMTVVVTVFRSVSGQWSPRVHRLMLDDQTMQNTLATLVGAYIYALGSIILLNSAAFSEGQIVVLFFFTILVLVLIIIAIVRWIVYLQTLGSLIDATRRVEQRTLAAMRTRTAKPCLGANPLYNDDTIPADAVPLCSDQTGYIQYIFEGALSELAQEQDLDIYINAPVGRFVHQGDVIAYLSTLNDKSEKVLRRNIGVGDVRTFEQDPRFGLVVLSEIGSRALSPGINDPGTAIDVLGRIARIFDSYVDELHSDAKSIVHPRLWVRPLAAADMIEDGFAPIARDGAGLIEVQIALNKSLSYLARHPDGALSQAALKLAQQSFENALQTMPFATDRDRLRAAVPMEVVMG
ncbi:DUF2254 domain-containing protein [Yoonia sp.]|uniref:DUF2254 domain-containing protein n=1 Tax=Yoonia sp. TaxID=2212373 RepID=UPI003F6D7DB1